MIHGRREGEVKETRRTFLKAAGFSTGAYMFGGCPDGLAGRAQPEQPNILFIMVDDLGKEWVSCYGSEEVVTPNIDALAAGGMRFENAYSMPQCTPTRVTLLTGQYPWRHGWVNHWDVPRWGAGCHFDWRHNASFARILKEAGYATAAAGKWQINDFRVTPDAMEKHGFDEYCMWTGFEADNPPSAERYWNPYLHTRAGSRTWEGKYSEDVFSDFLIDFARRNRGRPMLLYYPMCLTHGPYEPTPHDKDAKGNDACFKAMVRYMDFIVGRLVAALDELGLRQRTLVIWTTDNGTGGGSARMNGRLVRGGKAKLIESGICAPFIVNCPGRVPAGVVADALTDFSDILPTFATLAGARLPDAAVDGVSIADVISGRAKDSRREWILAMGSQPARVNAAGRVVGADTYKERAIRDKRYKLVIGTDRKARALYDLRDDPGEEKNLIDSTDPGSVAARKKLEAVAAALPAEDAAPRYEPTPPQPWDKKPAGNRAKQEET